MKEAFDRARHRDPDSPMARVIKHVNKTRAVESNRQRETRLFGQLKRKFYDLGQMCLDTRVDLNISRIPIEQKKKQWTQVLATLKDKPVEERIELLRALSSGMQLTEDITPANNSKYERHFPIAPPYRDSEPLGISFTRPSAFFMKAISDMSGYSGRQKKEFIGYVTNSTGLKGTVGLPELFPAISQWLDHTK